MKTLAALILAAFAWPASGQVQTIDRLVATVDVGADGAGHVVTAVTLPAGAGTVLRMPVPFGRPGSVDVRGVAGAGASVESDGGSTWVAVRLPDVLPDSATFELRYAVPRVVDLSTPPLAHGHRRLRYEFVNTTGAAVGAFEGTVLLPAHLLVSSLEEVSPRPAEPGVQPVTLDARDGRSAVVIRARAVGQGQRVGAVVELAPRSSSVPLVIGLAVVSAAYLYAFRDLTRAPRTSGV